MRSRAKVARMIAATARVLEREGYHGATTRKIAREAGVGVGSIYEYFPDKEALVVELVEREVAQLREELAPRFSRWRGMAFDEVLHEFFGLLVRFVVDRAALSRVIMADDPGVLEIDGVRRLDEAFRQLGETFARSRWPEMDAATFDARFFVLDGAVKGALLQIARETPAGISAERLADELARLVRCYVGIWRGGASA